MLCSSVPSPSPPHQLFHSSNDPISVDRCMSCKDLLSMGVEFDSWLDAVEPYAYHRHPPSIFLHVRKQYIHMTTCTLSRVYLESQHYKNYQTLSLPNNRSKSHDVIVMQNIIWQQSQGWITFIPHTRVNYATSQKGTSLQAITWMYLQKLHFTIYITIITEDNLICKLSFKRLVAQ